MIIDNTKCRQRVKALNIKLFRELTVRNREKTPDEDKKDESSGAEPKVGNAAFQSFTEEIMLNRSIFPGVQSKDKLSCSFEIKLSDIDNDTQQNMNFYKRYTEEARIKKMDKPRPLVAPQEAKDKSKLLMEIIAKGVLPSCESAMITCRYWLQLKFTHKGLLVFGLQIPRLKIPIWIQHQQVGNVQDFSAWRASDQWCPSNPE